MKWPVSFRGNGKTSIWGNSLFLKDGPGKFREVSDAIGVENYCPWGPSVGDLNADGFDDVFIASGMNYPFRYMVNSVKLNDRGQRFVDAEFALGVEPRRGGVTTPWFELDASGKDKGHRDAAGHDGRVAVWGARGTRSAAIFDVDGDGDLDIVTNEFSTAPMVLVSNLTEKTQVHYVAVKLDGTTSNRNGLGAVVKVTAGGSTYTKVLDGNSGYLSHSLYPLYFGLGAAEAVDGIEVVWPSGQEADRARRRSRSTRRSRCASRAAACRPRLRTGVAASARWSRRLSPAGSRPRRTAAPAARTARRSADPADRRCSRRRRSCPADR